MKRNRMTLAWTLVLLGLIVEVVTLELARQFMLFLGPGVGGPGWGIGAGIAAAFLARGVTVGVIVSCGLLVAGGVIGSRESAVPPAGAKFGSFLWISAALAGGILLIEGATMVPFLMRVRVSRAALVRDVNRESDFARRHWMLRDATGPIRDPFFIADGDQCGTSAGNDVVFWDMASEDHASRLELDIDKTRFIQITDVAVSRDGKFLAAVAGVNDRAVIHWARSGNQTNQISLLGWRAAGSCRFAIQELLGSGKRAWLHRRLYQFGPDGNQEEESLSLVDLETPRVVVEHDLAGGALIASTVDRKGRCLAVATRMPPGVGRVQIIDAAEGGIIEDVRLPTLPTHDSPIAVASTGRLIAYDDGVHSSIVALPEEGQSLTPILRIPSLGFLAAVAFDSEDRRVGFFFQENLPIDFGRGEWEADPLPSSVHVIDITTGETRVAMVTGNRHQARHRGLFSIDLSLLLVPGWNTLFRYDVASGRELLRGE